MLAVISLYAKLLCSCLWSAVMTEHEQPTALHHAHFIAFTQAAGLAAFASVLVNSALISGGADVVIVSYRK